MRKRLGVAVGLVVVLGTGVAFAQPGPAPAIVVAVLRAIGLFGDGYANGEVPTWSTAMRKFLPGSGGGMGAPTDATYVTQTANATLTNEVNLGADLAHIDFGLTPALTGSGIRLSNAGGIYARNQANTADRRLIDFSATNVVTVGNNAQNLDLGEAWVIDAASGNLCSNNAGCAAQSFYVASKQLRIGTPAVGNVGANSCGTTAAALLNSSNDTSGKFTVGATAGTVCRITFSAAWTNAPACQATDETTGVVVPCVTTTTTATITGTFGGADVISYTVIGH